MEARYDIRLDKAYINANNDLEWFASDIVHVEDTIMATPGTYKENPSDGIAIKNYLNSTGMEADISQKLVIQLGKDLYICNNPIVGYDNTGKLYIDANL